MSPVERSIAEILVNFAVTLGIDHCFSLTGGMAMFLNKAISDNPGIDITYCHQEQACVSAAEGYSKTSGFTRPGLACITAGPGVANSITGLLSAYGDSVPLLILAGQIKEADIDEYGLRTHGIQEIHSRELVTPAVKAFIRITKNSIVSDLVRITELFNSGRQGPVFVEIPLDIQNTMISDDLLNDLPIEIFAGSPSNIDSDLLSLIKHEISSAHRIVVMIGNGLRISSIDHRDLIDNLDKLNIPRLYTWLSFDLEDYASELNFGCPGSLASIHSNQILQAADLVIFLGVRLDLATTAFQRNIFGNSGKRIIIDIDEAELSKFDPIQDLKVRYDLNNGLDWMLTLLKERGQSQEDWVRSQIRMKRIEHIREDTELASDLLTVRNIALTCSEVLQEGVIVPASSGIAEETFTRFFRPNGEIRFFNGAALGSMGQGLSQGIGASRIERELPIWVFEGDGGLWMSVHEMATFKQIHPNNMTLFIFNNNGYGSIAISQERHFGYSAGSIKGDDIFLPSWESTAKLFDLKFILVTNMSELHAAYKEALQCQQPLVVELVVPLQEPRGPQLKSVISAKGLTTQPLGELAW